jgi:hypothetical protein
LVDRCFGDRIHLLNERRIRCIVSLARNTDHQGFDLAMGNREILHVLVPRAHLPRRMVREIRAQEFEFTNKRIALPQCVFIDASLDLGFALEMRLQENSALSKNSIFDSTKRIIVHSIPPNSGSENQRSKA